MFLIAAQILSEHVTDDDLKRGSVYPSLKLIKEVSLTIAIAITKYAYAKGIYYLIYLFLSYKINLKKKSF